MSLTTPVSTSIDFNPNTVNNVIHIDKTRPAGRANPTALLRLICDGTTTIQLQQHFVLSGADNISWEFFQDTHQDWYCRHGDHRFELATGMILAFNNQVWQFEHTHPRQPKSTVAPPEPATPSLHFQVSSDEEHVCLSIKNQGKSTELGERVHHYALLLLARQYRQDQQAGFNPGCCGWLDSEQLSTMIGIEAPILNVQLHRAKQQIAKVLPNQSLLERRVGQIRLNIADVKITRGGNVET